LERHLGEDPVPRGILAYAHLVLAQKEEALAWLERGAEERDQSVVRTVGLDPKWAPLGSEPRYQKLLARMNLQ